MIGITTNINFEKHEIFTTLFGSNKLLFKIYRKISINNTLLDKNEVQFLKDRLDINGKFIIKNNSRFIDINQIKNNNFDGYILKGIRESELKNGKWIDREEECDPFNHMEGCEGFNKYIIPKKELTSIDKTFNDVDFQYFVDNHPYNKFNKSSNLSFIVQDGKNFSIIHIEEGLFSIVNELCNIPKIEYNDSEQQLLTYIFSKFSFNYIDDIVKFVLNAHRYCLKNSVYDNIDKNIDSFLKSTISNDFCFKIIDNDEHLFCSSDMSFSVPIIFRTSIEQHDTDNIEQSISNIFNFYGNIIPLTGNKCIVISNSNFSIHELFLKKQFHLTYFYNILKEYYHYSLASINKTKNDYNLVKNSLFRYCTDYYTNSFVNDFKSSIFELNEISFGAANKKHISFLITKFLFETSISSDNLICEIKLNEVISAIYGENNE